jgi:hypothetical protein
VRSLPSTGRVQRDSLTSAQLELPFLRRSTSCAAASPAKMSPERARAQGSPGSAPASGTNTSASSVRCAPASSLSKTSRAARGAGCAPCGGACENSAIIRRPWGLVPPTSELPTSESGSLLWPTPTATQYGSARGGAAGRVGPERLGLSSAVKLWPTPTVSGEWNRKGASMNAGDGLRTAVIEELASRWPAPTASAATRGKARRGMNAQGGPSLPEAVANWATPNARDDKGPSTRAERHAVVCLPGQVGNGGKLNAEWVEALQGFPIGWTDVDFTPTTTRRRMKPGRTPVGQASIIYGPPVEARLSTPGSRRARSPRKSKTAAPE